MVQPLITSAELDELRADAESLMVDTIAFRRPGATTTDADGLQVRGHTALFTTKCEVTGRGQGEVAGRTVRIGEVEHVVLEGGINIPVTGGELRDGDEGVITAIGPDTDQTVLGNVYRVVGFGGRTWATKRRLDVVEV